MFRIKKILGPSGGLFFLILLLAAGCGAPKLDDDFLREEGGSSDSFIAEEIPDSSVIKRIDSLNSEIADLESLFRKISDKDLVTRMDSLLREISEIKRNISTPVQNDYSKLDSLEKAGLAQSEKIKEIEKKIKNLSEKKGVTLPAKSEVKHSFDKSPSAEINTFDDFNTNYDYAISLYNTKKYEDAYSVFKNLLNSKLKKPDLVDNLYFWMGECSFQKADYRDAIAQFKNVLQIPKANKIEDALWKLGLSNEKLNLIEEAREYLQRLMDSFPKSRYMNRAKAKLKTLI